MERPLTPRHAPRTFIQDLYEQLATSDTSHTVWREWHSLPQAERDAYLDAAVDRFARLDGDGTRMSRDEIREGLLSPMSEKDA